MDRRDVLKGVALTAGAVAASATLQGATATQASAQSGGVGIRDIPPIDPGIFKDPTTGLCSITYTGTTTNGTVACVRLQPQ